MEAEVDDGLRASLVAEPLQRLRQRLLRLVVVLHERQQGGEPRVRRRDRAGVPVVIHRAQMHVAIDQAGQHVLAGRIDGALARRQHRLRAQGHDLAAAHRHRGLQHLGGGDHATALDEQIDVRSRHHDLRGVGCVSRP